MIVETVRIVADALADDATGVNARLAALAVDAGDTVPLVARVLDAVSDDAVAAAEQVADWPVLMVAPGGQFEVEGATPSGQRRARQGLPISVAYASGDTGDPAERLRNAEYTIRAVTHVVTNMGQKERNGVWVLGVVLYTLNPLPTITVAGSVVDIEVIANLEVRDTVP